MFEGLFKLFAFVAFVMTCVLITPYIEQKKCAGRWAGAYPAEWSWLGGCRVEVSGKFLPEANVRATKGE